MPPNDYAPDYLKCGSYTFCSRRFREALATPDDVVQFVPIDLVAGGAKARAQDYQLMRVLLSRPTMDLDRSDCKEELITNRLSGRTRRYATSIDRFVLRDDFDPDVEIFRIEENSSFVVATDALAERVLRARCVGMEFSHIDGPQEGPRIKRHRTVDGIGERWVDY